MPTTTTFVLISTFGERAALNLQLSLSCSCPHELTSLRSSPPCAADQCSRYTFVYVPSSPQLCCYSEASIGLRCYLGPTFCPLRSPPSLTSTISLNTLSQSVHLQVLPYLLSLEALLLQPSSPMPSSLLFYWCPLGSLGLAARCPFC